MKVSILGIEIDGVRMKDLLALLDERHQETQKPVMVITPNPEVVLTARENPAVGEILEKADFCVPDGVGLIIAAKLKGTPLPERVPGVEVMEEVFKTPAKVYLYGGEPGIAEAAKEAIEKKYACQVVGTDHGYLKPEDMEALVDRINKSGASYLFVGLGVPRQEKWMHQYQDQLNVKAMFGIGGGIDVYAGKVNRAPIIFQKLALEWFYRLLQEPKRWRRMLAIPKFLFLILKEKIMGK